MSIDRAERTGFGISAGGHILLLAILSAGFLATRPLPPMQRQPIEVSLVDETGLESGAPRISQEPPAPKLAEVEGPVEPVPPTPVAEPEPAPLPKQAAPAPAPTPKPAKRQEDTAPAKASTEKSTSAKATPNRPTGRLKGLLKGMADSDSDSRSTTPPAATVTAAVRSSLAAEVRRQLAPHWKAPTGADAEVLRTELSISLARDGTVTDITFLRQTGLTDSNRAQADLHKERAFKAVRLASPFKLPEKYYDAWKLLSPIGFDKRLSQ